jgi:hypothetical protein
VNKKRPAKPVAEAAKLAHELVPVPVEPKTKPDWIESVLGEQAPHWNAFSPEVFNRVCERIAEGESLLKISNDPGMPSRGTLYRWCNNNSDYKREYDIAVQLRTEGILEETIYIIDDEKKMVTETVTEHEDGTKTVSRVISKDAIFVILR